MVNMSMMPSLIFKNPSFSISLRLIQANIISALVNPASIDAEFVQFVEMLTRFFEGFCDL